MNSSIDNSTLNSQKAVDGRKPETQQVTSTTGGPVQDESGPALSEDRVSLSGKTTTPPPESTVISTLNAARETVAKLKQLIANDPGSAVSAQQALNTDTATTALSRAAA